MSRIAGFVSNANLFRGLPPAQVEELSKIAETRSCRRGDLIFSDGDPADGLYLLLVGRVKIFKLSHDGKEQILHFIEAGEPFGEVALFLGVPFPAYAEALEESKVVFLPRTAFVEMIRKDPSVAMNMLAILSQRLKYFTRLIEDLSLKEVPARFAAYLIHGEDETDRDYVQLNIAKGQLARLLGTIPETLSRILGRMVAEGIIQVEGRKITLLNRPALEAIASGKRMI